VIADPLGVDLAPAELLADNHPWDVSHRRRQRSRRPELSAWSTLCRQSDAAALKGHLATGAIQAHKVLDKDIAPNQLPGSDVSSRGPTLQLLDASANERGPLALCVGISSLLGGRGPE
jgi:hypothetical protein